ncbi:MAG: P-loop NTPase [Clostridia bacterium]|nr:P-loop NTPase [Clostridia bacterium]
MAHIILVTSFKGGVGKSTVSANLALKLARLGQKVLLCDLDFDLGTLDLITGCEDRMLFDVCDAVYGRRDVEDCAVTFPSVPGLYLLGAPFRCTDEIVPEDFAEKLSAICEPYDYAVLDTPGADSVTVAVGARCADSAIVVATHNPTSLRGAEKTAQRLRDVDLPCRLVINNFDAVSVSEDKRTGMISMIDATKTPLLGVVPYDRTLMFAQEKGVLVDGDSFPSSKAFENIAQRLIAEKTGGRPVPVLSGVIGRKRKKVLTK